ncbi:hypothetical protein [Lacipirellula sp.]|uniref:hypothetical protein n=1 Tax=Lacipirellula sp. TaxID=2691419 RepID=UPI003D133AB5
MDRKYIAALLLGVAVGGLLTSAGREPVIAAEATTPAASAAPLQVVAYASGLTGFFDPAEKKLYLYGADLKTPFMTAEIDELGKPLKVTQLVK